MQCPIDGATLVMSERQGIEIDYCPQCRGVWLDRGEIDKIIERSVGTPQPGSYQQQPRQEQRDERRYEKRDYEKKEYERRDYDDDRRQDNRRGHHRESWLGDLFG